MTLNAKLLEFVRDGLNDAATDVLDFAIFSEVGERESVRTNDFETREPAELLRKIYGTLYLDPSNRAPIKGLSVLTIRATLEVLCELHRSPVEADGAFSQVETVRAILDAFAESNNGVSIPFNDGGTSYTIVPNFSPSVCGDVQEIVSDFGEVIPVLMSITFTAVEAGVSSNDVTVYIDGYPVYAENIVFSRSKVVDQYTYADRDSIKANVVQHGFGVDFVAPLLANELGDILISEVLLGSFNEAHAVSVERETIERETGERKKVINTYLCIFGNSSANLQPGKNVGATVSLVEGKKDLLSFDTRIWYPSTTKPTKAEIEEEVGAMPSADNRVLFVLQNKDGTWQLSLEGLNGIIPGNENQTAKWMVLRNGF